MEKSDEVVLDINELAKSVTEEFKSLSPFSDKYCIYKVPNRLRGIKKKVYTPQVVSIGPFHHGKHELKAMEDHKKVYLQDFLIWSNRNLSLEDFIMCIAKREKNLRNCYAGTTKQFSSKKFVKMILLDAAFIIMVLLKYNFGGYRRNNDSMFCRPWMINEVGVDMCLLENQVPFSILQELLKLSNILNPYGEDLLIRFTHKFLKGVWDSESWVTKEIEIENFTEAEHFVDFLRIYQQPTMGQKRSSTLTIRPAMELHQAGVKFDVIESRQKLLHFEFSAEGTLKIPQLKISDVTEILLRNLQAFEQCHCLDNYIGSYIHMMDLLVNVPKDVEILVQNGIIENWLPNNEAVSVLFYNLSRENCVSGQQFYFSGILEDLDKYCRNPCPEWKVTLKQKYFNNPWAIISVLAAGFLLILTVIQAVCSIIQIT